MNIYNALPRVNAVGLATLVTFAEMHNDHNW
jgi:hypothetical protein